MLSSENTFICSICLEFESEILPDWFVTTPSGHIFHFKKCIKEWLDRGERRCPLCNEELSIKKLTRLRTIDPVCRRTNPSASCSTASKDQNNKIEILPVLDTNGVPDYAFKIILIGDAAVGKSSLLQRYTTGMFNFTISETIGCEMSFKTVVFGNKTVKLSLWDTSGQERFHSISQNFVRNAHGVMFVFSYGQETQSLQSLQRWIKFVDDNGIPGAAMMIVENKADIKANRKITTRQGQDFARSQGFTFFETSAKDHYNVDAAFSVLVVEIVHRVETKQLDYRNTMQERAFRLQLRKSQEKRKIAGHSCC